MALSITKSLTVAATAHAANDVCGGLITLNGLGAVPGIRLKSVIIAENAGLVVTYKLTLFNATPTTILDDAAFSPTDADITKIIEEVSLDAATYQLVYPTNSVHRRNGLDLPLISTTQDLYAYLWSPTGGTFVATVVVGLTLIYEIDR